MAGPCFRPALALSFVSLLVSVLGAVGCAGAPAGQGDESAMTSTGDESDSTGESTSETNGETNGESGEPPPSGAVIGWVTDIDGVAIADLPVALCGQVCQVANTDADGRFEVTAVAPGAKVLEPALVPVGDEGLAQAVISWTRFFDIITVADQPLMIAEPLVMQRVENAIGPLTGPQSLTPAPGLEVDVDADAILASGPLPVGADGVWLGATEVPSTLWPQGGLDGWQILAAWRFAIWDLEAEDGFTVRATLPTALDPQAEVGFLVADYTYGFLEGTFFLEAATLSDDGTVLSTPVDGGLDRATMWLAVTR